MKKTIFSAITAIVLCLSLVVGGTFALFTSEYKTNIAITSGNVEITANIDESKIITYSPKAINLDGKVTDTANVANGLMFFNGGSVAYNAEKATLGITDMTPGDEVHFNIDVTNNSNVTIQYRVEISDVAGGSLNGLVFEINNEAYKGTAINSDWKTVEALNAIDSIPVSIVFPADANDDYESLTTELSIKVVAVQGNTAVQNGLKTIVDNATLKAAIDAKQDYTINSGEFSRAAEADTVTVTINGGNFTSQIVAARNGSTVIINDAATVPTQTGSGSYNSPSCIANVNSGSKLIINGGTYLVGTLFIGDGTGTIEITGGHFDGMFLYMDMGKKPFESLTITGGTFCSGLFVFGSNLANHVPDTHQIVNNADGSCTVVAK